MGRLFHKVVEAVVKERPPKERQVGNVLVRVGAVVWRVMRAGVRMGREPNLTVIGIEIKIYIKLFYYLSKGCHIT